MPPQILELPPTLPASALADRIVLVTGASRGFGRAVALAAAAHGATVLLLGRDVRRLEGVADEIEASGAPAPLIVPVNLEGAGVDDYAGIAGLIGERFGRLDGLVLNAAMLGEMSEIANYDPILWARVFQVNVHAPFLLVRACLPWLRCAAASSLVFLSSSVGRRGRAYWGAYAASKFAVEGLMQTLADELREATPVRVYSFNPGRMRTRMRAQAYPAENPGTLPDPAEIAPCVVHLLTAPAALHGATLERPATRAP